MLSEEDISTLYARDYAPTEDVKKSCLLADENRERKTQTRWGEPSYEEFIDPDESKNKKMQTHFSSMSSLKQGGRYTRSTY